MIAALEFLGMKKLIEVSPGALSYEVLLPFNSAPATTAAIEQRLLRTEEPYLRLIFIQEPNCRYGLPKEPKLNFIFDSVKLEYPASRMEKEETEEDLWDTFHKELNELRCEAEKLMKTCDIISYDNKRLKEEIKRLKEDKE